MTRICWRQQTRENLSQGWCLGYLSTRTRNICYIEVEWEGGERLMRTWQSAHVWGLRSVWNMLAQLVSPIVPSIQHTCREQNKNIQIERWWNSPISKIDNFLILIHWIFLTDCSFWSSFYYLKWWSIWHSPERFL